MVFGRSDHHEPKIILLVREKLREGFSYAEIGKMLGMSRGQVAGIVDRHTTLSDKSNMKPKAKTNEPGRLLPGSLGVIEKQMADPGRITLIGLPSLGELQPAQYSYISRDRIVGKKTRSRQSPA